VFGVGRVKVENKMHTAQRAQQEVPAQLDWENWRGHPKSKPRRGGNGKRINELQLMTGNRYETEKLALTAGANN